MTYPSKMRAYKRAYYLANKERCRALQKKRYAEQREKILAQCKEYGRTHRLECNKRHRKYHRLHKDKVKAWRVAWDLRHPGRSDELHKKYRLALRQQTIAAYGGKCNCCGEETFEFLSIDHINGKGNEHRKALGREAGLSFYRWLRQNKWPKGYRVLCYNCNCARGFYGYCPHTRDRIQQTENEVKQ